MTHVLCTILLLSHVLCSTTADSLYFLIVLLANVLQLLPSPLTSLYCYWLMNSVLLLMTHVLYIILLLTHELCSTATDSCTLYYTATDSCTLFYVLLLTHLLCSTATDSSVLDCFWLIYSILLILTLVLNSTISDSVLYSSNTDSYTLYDTSTYWLVYSKC